MNENNHRCQNIIEQLGLHPRVVTHEPILNYETAEKVDKELGLTGAETKTLFLKGRSGQFYIYLTLSDCRMDQKQLRDTFGEKVKLVQGDEMIDLTGMQPGCMTPFGLCDDLIKAIAINTAVYDHDKLICAYGSETMSMEIESSELKQLLEAVYHDNIFYL